ncbi:hypothetical protein [Jeotgalibacillus campisalis]|uniref:Uncharacterized protein n=1 Tax=Jeotgalibacillus campisalis TaxID=220754 RepID=A0A0C2VWL2_9BACL|nr:hypothetical protein [Jeotgalibacillus campisalis]KIL48363.1 hypothetical protein KR50_13990 [Jeotgalibacillus campisalis]
MLDQDWLIDSFTKAELVLVCKELKVNVHGFQRNLFKAPEVLLTKSLNDALNVGTKRKKQNAISVDDITKKIYMKLLENHPYLREITFEEFIIRAEIDTSLSISEMIIISIEAFIGDYKKHKLIMIENYQKGEYLFSGLSKELSRPLIKKINNFIFTDTFKESRSETLHQYVKNIKGNKLEYYESIIGEIRTEDDLFKRLMRTQPNNKLLVIVSFLLYEDNYKLNKYSSLLEFSITEIQEFKLITTSKILEKELEDNIIYKKENRELNDQVENLKIAHNEYKRNFIKLDEDLKKALQMLNDTKVKNITLEKIAKKHEPLIFFFLRLISENKFIIITNERGQITNTIFEDITLSPSELKKNLRNNSNSFNDHIIFVTRVSFQTGKDWFKFKRILEEYKLTYEELGHYELSDNLIEIVGYLNRKEILVYADEI